MNQSASATFLDGSHENGINDDLSLADHESLRGDQLTGGKVKEKDSPEPKTPPGGDSDSDNDSDASHKKISPIDSYIRDAELASTRYDGAFWSAVNLILTGCPDRYVHSHGEKKAAERAYKNHAISVGAVLAALRAVMALPTGQRPSSFGAAIKLPAFHAYLQQAIALLPARLTPPTDTRGWFAFIAAYRALDQKDALRDVSVPDYHTLKAIFDRQPDACWQVLSNIGHAEQAIKLTPRYLQRAIENNLREQTQQAILPVAQTADCGPSVQRASPPRAVEAVPDDPRITLLLGEGVRESFFQPAWTEALITAWIAEADARRDEIRDRAGWLIWGLQSGRLPGEILRVQRAPSSAKAHSQVCKPLAPPVLPEPAPSEQAQTWASVQVMLKQRIDRVDYDTWVRDTMLVELADREAVIATPNVFAREKMISQFAVAIEEALHSVLSRPVLVQYVIDGGRA